MTASGGVTAVIVSRDLRAMLEHCVEHLVTALDALDPGPHRIVVVDNASAVPYATGAAAPGPEVLRVDRHTSFAHANNLAARAAANHYYLLLNNDVFLSRSSLREMFDVLVSEPRAGICGARLV